MARRESVVRRTAVKGEIKVVPPRPPSVPFGGSVVLRPTTRADADTPGGFNAVIKITSDGGVTWEVYEHTWHPTEEAAYAVALAMYESMVKGALAPLRADPRWVWVL